MHHRVAATASSNEALFPVSSRMQKEIQRVRSGFALDKLKEQDELPIPVQRQLVCNVVHGESEKKSSTGLVEMIVSGTGLAEDARFSQETEIVDPNVPTQTTAISLQIKNDPATTSKVAKKMMTKPSKTCLGRAK